LAERRPTLIAAAQSSNGIDEPGRPVGHDVVENPAARLQALLERRTAGEGVLAGVAASAPVGESRGLAAVMAARSQGVPKTSVSADAAPSIPPKITTVTSVNRFMALLP